MGPALLAASDQREAAEPDRSNPRLNVVNYSKRSPKEGNAADLARMNAVRCGDAAQTARFIKEISGTVWSACRLLTRDDAETRTVFSEVMASLTANRCARLNAYSGKGTLATFVALNVRELLVERMLRLLQIDSKRAWHAFERLFESDIQRLIRKRFPGGGEDVHRDMYQDICIALIEDDYRRLKSYGGSGSFAGFALRTVDHLLIDFMRSVLGRRGVRPKCVSVDQLEDVACEGELSPEERVIEADEHHRLAAAVEVLSEAMKTLPAAERVYLRIALGGHSTPPAREIARLMGRPVEDIYKLKQRVLQRLREIIADDSKIKTWRASV
jgi:RNA polymerase sigma factor (sigma-70 family)